MIYLFLILSFNSGSLDIDGIKNYSPEERKNITIELIRQEKYETALMFSPNRNITGCIKILDDKFKEGIEDIQESAAKGNLFSVDLYLLFQLEVSKTDLKNFVRKELCVLKDSAVSYESPFTRYLVFSPESLYVCNISADSILHPYILFKSGMVNLEKDSEKATEFFEDLIENFPNSLPAVVARNTLRSLKK